MSAPTSVGTTTAVSTLFNSGILTLNGLQVGELQDIVINNSFTEKNYYAVNSIIKRKIRRSNLVQSVSFNITGGMFRELTKTFFGASSPVGSGLTYNVYDGQQTSVPMLITAYEDDNTAKAYQITVIDPLMISNNWTLTSQDFETISVEFACTQLTIYQDTAVAN
jgi:sporulation protein YlmC with PRC-barrel domain